MIALITTEHRPDPANPVTVTTHGDQVHVILDPEAAKAIAASLAQSSDRWDPFVVDLICAASNVPAPAPGFVHVPLLGTAS